MKVLSPAEAGKIFLSNAANFNDERAHSAHGLSGRTITADFSAGNFRMRHDFDEDGKTLTWSALTGPQSGDSRTVPYQAFEVRPGITGVLAQPLEHEAVILIVDDNRGRCAGLLGRRNSDEPGALIELKRLEGEILEADVDTSNLFKNGSDLGGTRFTVVYPGEVAIYEHIYLNDHYVTWLGHKGTSAGVADTERYEAFRIAPLVYLVAWTEKSAPLQISYLFDFEQMREHASIFGFDESSGRYVYQTTSADIAEIKHSNLADID